MHFLVSGALQPSPRGGTVKSRDKIVKKINKKRAPSQSAVGTYVTVRFSQVAAASFHCSGINTSENSPLILPVKQTHREIDDLLASGG